MRSSGWIFGAFFAAPTWISIESIESIESIARWG